MQDKLELQGPLGQLVFKALVALLAKLAHQVPKVHRALRDF